MSVEKSAEFLKDNKDVDLVQFFNDRLEDTCATFAELKQIMKMWPKKDQWSKGNLPSMRREMLSTLAQQQRAKYSPSPDMGSSATSSENGISHPDKSIPAGDSVSLANLAHRKLSWKDRYLQLEKEYITLKAQHKQLEKDYREMKQLIAKKVA